MNLMMIFSLNTLWYDNDTYATTNRMRGKFFRLCRNFYPKIEGGFFYIGGSSVEKEFPKYRQYLEEYKDILYRRRIGLWEY